MPDISEETQAKVNLFPQAPISWVDYLLVESSLCERLERGDCKNPFETILAINELLAEAVRITNNNSDLGELKEFTPDSLIQWKIQSPTFFEIRVLNLFCYRNFVFPLAARESKKPLTDTKVLKSAVNTTLLGRMEVEGIGRIDVGKAQRLKIQALPDEMTGLLLSRLQSNISSRNYFGAAKAGLSVIAGYNSLIGNLLSAVTYARCHALHSRMTEIQMANLEQAFQLIDSGSDSLKELPLDQSSFYDSGFSSPRLFNRLLGQAAVLSGAAK